MGTKGVCVQREKSGGPLSPVFGAYTRSGSRMRRLGPLSASGKSGAGRIFPKDWPPRGERGARFPLPRSGGRLVQKPQREIDREPGLEEADSLLFGDLYLGGQDESRAGRRARVHKKGQASAKQTLGLSRSQQLKFRRSHTGLLPCRISRSASYRFESGTLLSPVQGSCHTGTTQGLAVGAASARLSPLYGKGVTLPGGTVTFLFTDIEGSTRLLQELGDDYGQVVADHRRLLREIFQAAGGNEVDTQGDAFFYSFPRARDAVRAAVDGQRALAAHEWPRGVDVRVRMGLHTGEPTVGEEGYVGLDVVRAARICSAGHGGQILVSETTRALLGNDVPDGVNVRDLGRQHLKDVQYEHVYELSLEESGEQFPPLKEHDAGGSMEQRFEDRINRYVEDQLEAALGGPPHGHKPGVPKGCLLALAIAAIVVIVVVVKLV